MTTPLIEAQQRVADALREFGAVERTIVTQGEVVDLLLDLQQYLKQVPEPEALSA